MRLRTKILQWNGSNILSRWEHEIWSEKTLLGRLGSGLCQPQHSDKFTKRLCAWAASKLETIVYVTWLAQWSSETMNVKVLCKLESYLLPLTSTSELTQFFSPPQHATASSLLPPKSRRLIPAVLSTSAAWREGLSEDPEGAWTSPPPPPQRACALSTAPPPSGAGTVAWVMGNVALGHCVAAWLFLHYSGYSFRLNKDQRPRLLSQATWVPMLVPPMTGEVTGIRTNTSQYLLSIQIRQPCSEGFSCISSDDLHNNLMRSAQLLFSYSGQWN